MSMGYGGSAKIVLQDEETVIYKYSPYNLNDPEYRNPKRIYDGFITISKNSLVEPDIHTKIKRMPSGRKKLLTKRIPRDVDYSLLFDTGKITVENSSYCWILVGQNKNVGMIAMRIIFKIFDYYQDNGCLPETISLNY